MSYMSLGLNLIKIDGARGVGGFDPDTPIIIEIVFTVWNGLK